MAGSWKSTRRSWPLGLILALITSILTAAPAGAAPAAPNNLSPANTSVSGIPVLSWERVPTATSYDVQLSTSDNFNSTFESVSKTVNSQFVPKTQLPMGEVWWRVRSVDSSGTSDWATAKITRSTLSGPALLGPADGVELSQPDQPTSLAWTPVDGATDYVLEISTDKDFIDPKLITTHTTKTTSFVVPAPQLATIYFWRVRATLRAGVFSDWSGTRQYQVRGLPNSSRVAPVPGPGEPSDSFPTVDDAVLDWTPVAGAKTYDLQISTDINFNTLDHFVNGVTGTSYARPQTLNNDQYYWRVRPVDVNNNKPDWDTVPTWRFRRAWSEQPKLEHPINGTTVGDPFYFEWTPVKLASSYTIEMSRNSTFSPESSVQRCTTVHTTFTPGDAKLSNDDCFPTATGTYHWRVIATDWFKTTDGPVTDRVVAQVETFTYLPDRVQPITPSHRQKVEVPILSWEPQAGAAKYKVTITPTLSGSPVTATTAATSFTPRNLLAVGSSYRWQVQAVSEDGRLGSETLIGSQPTFEVVAQAEATADTPEPSGPSAGSFGRFPTLSWAAVAGADRYRLLVRKVGTLGWERLSATFRYPAGEDDGTNYLEPAEYEWMVEAYNGTAFVSDSTSTGRFTIAPPTKVTGHRAAVTAEALRSPETSCAASLPNECQDLRQTPVLRWEPSPDTGYYQLYLSRDRELTNLLPGFPKRVSNTKWIPPSALADSQAGSAYFWYVRPCTAAGYCAKLDYADRAFNKLSNPVDLLTHNNRSAETDVELVDDIALSWSDYLATNTNASSDGTSVSTPARIEARRYRVQVATDPNFQTGFLDDVEVDQTSFTSFTNTYPEGPVYWRVQALDGSGNALTWSKRAQFTKKSPVPELVSPITSSGESHKEVSGNEQLTWTPLDFAASYDLEVYKNEDTNPISRVVSLNSRQITVSLASPLPVSELPYMWRVRRVDAKDRRGNWSGWGKFVVVGQPPVLDTPAADTRVPPSDALFTWEPATGATPSTYRFERAAVGSSTIVETVTTAARAYAPTKTIPQGDWRWRVTALDVAGNALGASDWRAFTVFSAPQPVTNPLIDGSGKVGTVLSGTPGTWDLAGVTDTYQWLRGTTAIAGATGLTYEVTSNDLGKNLILRVTGSKPGYSNGVALSEPVMGVEGEPLLINRATSISGPGKVGTVLTSTPAEWALTGVNEKYQWLRDGEYISRATATTYTVTKADVGTSLSLRVTGTKTGYAPGVTESNAITGVLGDAAVNTVAPAITGDRKVGAYLTASKGTWTGSSLRYTYQWLRNGNPISGATSYRYRLVTADAARSISVRVTATRDGYEPGLATSTAVRIAKLDSATAATLASTLIKPTQQGTAYIVVKVPGVARPTGTLRIFDGSTRIKVVKLPSSAAGKRTVRLPRLKVGKHSISVRYSGTPRIKPSRSPRVVLTVRR
jgi:large repetitive protein